MLGTCVLPIVPLAAHGDEQLEPAVAVEVAEALETREQINELNAAAVEAAPPAVGSSCRRTLDVEGLGEACATPEGLLRVEQSDGRSHTTHGMDAPPIGEAASLFTPGSVAAVNGASVADISCTSAPSPRYVLVYARPSNVASRYATIAPKLQQETYRLSAFIDAVSQSITPGASRRLPVACEGGTPAVLNLELSGLQAGTASFANIVDGLRAHGLEFNGDGSNSQRYIVYYDSPSPTMAAGTGHVFASDATAGAANSNNTGGLYAVEYRYAEGGGLPHWDVLIHEVLHTMGAVVTAAPHNSGFVGSAGAGHCTDGLDIMCYDDNGSRGSAYNPSVCSSKVLDCNRDDYFNPSPAAGSYLATHWNVAATYNRFLVADGGVRAPRAATPTVPKVTGLRRTGASNSAVGLAWKATGSSSYVVGVRQADGSWRDVLTTAERQATVSGLRARTSYEFGVGVAGSTDRATVRVTTTAARDRAKPTRPGAVRVRRTSSTITFRWKASRDNVGVARYQLRQLTTSNGKKLRKRPRVAARSTGPRTTLSTRSLKDGATHRFQVVALDSAGNVSRARTVRVKIPKDRRRPTRPRKLRSTARTASTVTLSWAASRDASGISRYTVYQRVGKRWVPLRAKLTASKRRVRVTGLRRRTTHSFRVVARDRAGNRSVASKTLSTRTR